MANKGSSSGYFENKLGSFGRWLDSYLPCIMIGFGTIGLAFAGPLTESAIFDCNGNFNSVAFLRFGVVFLACVSLLVGGIWQVRLNVSISKIKEENLRLKSEVKSDEDYFEVWKRFLCVLSKKLNLSDKDRISIYRKTGDRFILLGRYSENPEYAQKGRGIYPANQGFLNHSFLNGCTSESNLPCPTSDNDSYRKNMLERWNFPASELDRIRMKIRAFIACPIKDSEDVNRIGVAVIESVNPSSLEFALIRAEFDSHWGKLISLLLNLLSATEPDPSLAEREGF